MRVTCSTCASVFEVGDGEIGPGGSNVRCPTCGSLNMVGGRPAGLHASVAGQPLVPGRTISLDATDEPLELEDDALIELDDADVTLTTNHEPSKIGRLEGAPTPAELDLEVSEAESNPIAPNPFALPVETTPPMADAKSPSAHDWGSPYDAAKVRETHEIDVSGLDFADETPKPMRQPVSDVPFDAPHADYQSRADSFNEHFEVLGGGGRPDGAPDEATLVVRKRRTPREDEAAAILAGLSPDEMPLVPDDVEHTMPRVRQDELARNTTLADHATDPRTDRSITFQRKESRAGKILGWTLGAIVVLGGAGGGYYYLRLRPIEPPEVPNPLERRANDWRKSGAQPQFAKVDDAAAAVIEGLASGTNAGRERALNAAKAAVLADPKSPGAVSLYARALAARDEPVDNATLNDVLGAITSVIGEAPNDSERPSLEASRAWLLLRAGRVEAAREAAARAVTTRSDYAPAQVVALAADVALKPEYAAQQLALLLTAPEVSGEARLWMGEAQLQSGHVGEALATWRAGLRNVPADAPFVGRLARVQADLGDYSSAVDLLSQNVARGAATLGDVLLLARLQSRALHKPKNALETLDTAQAERASQPFALANLVAERVMTIYSVSPALAPADEVRKLLETNLAAQPDVPTLIYAGGVADLATGQAKKAAESFEAAQTLAPDVPEIAFALASLSRTSDVGTAYEVVGTALKDHPDYLPLHLLEALIAAEHDDKARAAAAVKKALLYDPALYTQRVQFAAYAEPTQQIAEVAKALGEQAVRLDNTLLRTAAGVLYTLIGDSKNGPLWLTKALRDDPNDVGARLYSAIYNLKRGAKKPARADVIAAERGDRRQPLLRLYKARILEQLNKASDAGKIYRDLLDQNGLNAAAHVGLARVMRSQGDEPGAREEAKKALSVRPRDRDAMRMLVAEVPEGASARRPR